MSGQLIAGRYRLEHPLGAGGMGVVWLATDLELGRTVALKRSHTNDTEQVRREARIGAGLTHPQVVTVFDVVTDHEDRWLVMEYLPSRGLDEVLTTDGPLPPESVRRIGAELAGALAAMHGGGIVHRDIKPANVLIAEDGSAKLTDLGIARWTEATVTDGAHAAGTSGYLAPEVANGFEAGPAADVFSLGATMYAAATGGSPWGSGASGPYAQLRRASGHKLEPLAAAGELAPLLGRLMARNPERRPSAIQTHGLLTGTPTAVRPLRLTPGGRWFRWRQRWLILATAAVVAVLLVGIGLLTAPSYRTPSEVAAPGPGALGDPRTADPCALLVPGSLARFGKVLLEPNYGGFNHCDLTVDPAGENDTIDVALELQSPDEYPAVRPVPGKLGQVQADPPEANRCQRTIGLPNLYRVVIFARQVNEKPAPLCGAAEAVALATYGLLAQGPIPRRAAFQPGSTGSVDACALLSGKDVATAFGTSTGPAAEPDYGRWTCYWEQGAKQVTVSFSREWPLAGDPPDGTKMTVGGRVAYVDTTTNNDRRDECGVTLVHRRYTPTVPSVKGTPREREETVAVSFENEETTNGEILCPAAITLARTVVSRLPR